MTKSEGVTHMSEAIDYLLRSMEIHPVLVDIGASGSPPRIWERVASHSIYVGFDPDEREIREIHEGRFLKATIINEAVISDADDEVVLYLTASPYCSSTLRPDHASLSNYLFSDLFTVERLTKVRATSLDAVIDRLSLPGIDWFKTDSQGTDLRLFNNLRAEVRSRVLAVDIEPGLIDAYVGEDLFVDAHRELTRSGFWLSNLNVCGAIRMQRSTLEKMTTRNKELNDGFIEKTIRKSPGWCEARYLRTIEWLAQGDFAKRDYVLLWVFALLDGQSGFAIDLGIEYEQLFGTDDVSQVMQDEPIVLMRRARQVMRFAAVKSFPLRIMHRIMRPFKKLG